MDLARLDDEALLAARAVGQAGPTFAEFYRRHERLVIAFHMRRVRDPETAADLAAETFAQALASRARFTADGGPGSAVRWLYGIAGNVLRRSYRQARVEQDKLAKLRLDRPSLDDDQLDAIVNAGGDASVLAALEMLPPEQRAVVRGFVVDDVSYDDLAAAHDLQPAAVRKRVSRGLASMRRDLEETS